MKKFTVLLALLMMFSIMSGCAQKEEIVLYDPAGVTSADDDGSWYDGGYIDSVYMDGGAFIDLAPEMVPLAGEIPFIIPVPEASGKKVKKNEKGVIDYSNMADGYIMAKYIPKDNKSIKMIIKGPTGGAQYQYNLKGADTYEVFPLTDGNGKYQVMVVEALPDNKAALIVSETIDVKLTDEYAPFIRPSQYVSYTKDSEVVKKAAELVKGKDTVLAKVTEVFSFVTKNFSYDKKKAEDVLNGVIKAGYIPDVDAVLKDKKGICFDYATVMVAMLRSQEVPAKLVIGYAGTTYHAWINVYSSESGWIDSIVQFDGKSWKLMDPTYASTGGVKETEKLIGDGKNYTVKYLY